VNELAHLIKHSIACTWTSIVKQFPRLRWSLDA